MAVTYQAKTEVALTTTPQTINHPTGTTNGDWLVMVAGCSSPNLTPQPIDKHKFKWNWSVQSTGSNLSLLVAYKKFVTGDTAPSLTTNSTGYAFMYRYSGVTSVRFINQSPVAGTTLDCPYTSAESGEEVVWVGCGRKTATAAPTITLSRGTVQTNQNANFLTLVAYPEALGSGVTDVQATMSQTGTPDYVASASVVLSDKAAYVYKGRDSASSDTTGAA